MCVLSGNRFCGYRLLILFSCSVFFCRCVHASCEWIFCAFLLRQPTKDRAKVRRKGAGTQGASSTATVADSEPRGVVEDVQQEYEAVDSQYESPQETSSPENLPSLEATFQTTSVNVSQARGANVRKLQDSWANQAPISVKPLRKPAVAASSPTRGSFNQAPSQIKHALLGLVNNNTSVISPPSPPLTPPLVTRSESAQSRQPQSPRHSRIPSTGSRPTVMDVAQAFSAAAAGGTLPTSPIATSPQVSQARSPVQAQEPQTRARDLERDPGGWGESEMNANERTITPAMLKAERRRSNYEKYANFTLPVLKEEKTPAPTPVQTLKEKDITGSAEATEAASAAKSIADSQDDGGEEKTVEELVASTGLIEQQTAKVHIGK